MIRNLTSKRYKTCGHGVHGLDKYGHDEVLCAFSKELRFCGECVCPLDQTDQEPPEIMDDNSAEEHEDFLSQEPDPGDTR